MQYFSRKAKEWYIEEVPLRVIAEQFGTPCYVYAEQAIRDAWLNFDRELAARPHSVNYAVKANSNLAILKILHDLGSGFDIVSYGELARLIHIGCDPQNIIFSGVGKTLAELRTALEVGVGCINVESLAELTRLNQLALDLGVIAKIALRINPEIDLKDLATHPYISTGMEQSKFGLDLATAEQLCLTLNNFSGVKLIGLAFHLGSQILTLEPFKIAISKILALIKKFNAYKIPKNLQLEHINVGGGLGVNYAALLENDPRVPSIPAYINMLLQAFNSLEFKIYIEPGRSIVANAGVLLTKVEYLKATTNKQHFAIVDAAMNDLIRPALYGAWHPVMRVQDLDRDLNVADPVNSYPYDIVGPICETSDFLARSRVLNLAAGDLLMLGGAGAYGASMSSNYNSRPRAAEVLVKGRDIRLIRKRETVEELFRGEIFY